MSTSRPPVGPTKRELKRAIALYKDEHQPKAKQEKELFRDMTDFERVLHRAAYALKKTEPRWVRFRHQNNLTKTALHSAYEVLLSNKRWLSVKRPFEELHEFMKKVVENIPGLGELYAYDTALRLGFHHKVEPKDVYLHAGTRIGAFVIHPELRNEFRRQGKIPLKRLREELLELPAHEIENFLCIFHTGTPSARSC